MIRHLIYVVLGLGAGAAMLLVPLSFWQRMDWMLLLAAFGLLILVLLPGIGREVNGSMRWIGFGAFNVQPSELAKVFVVIYLAGFIWCAGRRKFASLWGFAKPFLCCCQWRSCCCWSPTSGRRW